MSFEGLAKNILKIPSRHRQRLIGIDGGGGAGKSTFAEQLGKQIPNAFVIHGDDFYIGPWDKRLDNTDYEVNPLYDWNRFYNEVLKAVEENRPVQYHVYDWHEHNTDKIVSVPDGAVIIVEGGYTTQRKFVGTYDFKIWIEADEKLRLDKALRRDGEHMRFLWEGDWLPVERNYMIKDNPMSRADLVVQGHVEDFSKGIFSI